MSMYEEVYPTEGTKLKKAKEIAAITGAAFFAGVSFSFFLVAMLCNHLAKASRSLYERLRSGKDEKSAEPPENMASGLSDEGAEDQEVPLPDIKGKGEASLEADPEEDKELSTPIPQEEKNEVESMSDDSTPVEAPRKSDDAAVHNPRHMKRKKRSRA